MSDKKITDNERLNQIFGAFVDVPFEACEQRAKMTELYNLAARHDQAISIEAPGIMTNGRLDSMKTKLKIDHIGDGNMALKNWYR